MYEQYSINVRLCEKLYIYSNCVNFASSSSLSLLLLESGTSIFADWSLLYARLEQRIMKDLLQHNRAIDLYTI